MIRVVIGTQPNQTLPHKVLAHSIRVHTREAVEIRPTLQPRAIRRRGGTRFGFVRFLIPQMFGFRGRAIYLDADQVVLWDIRELWESLDAQHAVALVRAPEGRFAGRPVPPRVETSVMVLDCAKLEQWDPQSLFDNVVPNRAALRAGQIHYRDFMRLQWFDPEQIQTLDPRWNHYNLVREDTRNVHFSHVRDQPWKRPRHPLRDWWAQWLERAIRDGAISRREILNEVARLHLHPRFLPQAFSRRALP